MKHGTLDHLPEQPVSHDPAIHKRVLFMSGEIPHVTQVSQASLLPGQVVPPHAHQDMYEVFLCLRGRGSIVTGAPSSSITAAMKCARSC